MKKRVWNRRIPTVFAFFILIFGLWITSFLLQKGVIYIGHASPDTTPQNILISNITDSSFTANFTTNAQTTAGISVTGGTTPIIAYDSRDKKPGSQKFFSHFITVTGLNPKTVYHFSILLEGQTYLNNGREYTVTTGDKISASQPNSNPIKGLVLLPEGGASGDSILKIEIQNAENITSVASDNGEYSIPTNNIRSSNLASFVALQKGDTVTLTAYRQDMTSITKFLFSDALVPPITMNQQYDFTSASIQQEATNNTSELKVPEESAGKSVDIKITTPTASQSFIDSQPKFSGTALPNQTVKIVIQPINATVTSDRNGSWSYRPDGALAPGEHTITIFTLDQLGITRTTSQVFNIFPTGSQVGANEENPLVSPVPNGKPTVTPTLFLKPTITPSPTRIAPSATPTLVPSPTPTLVASVTPGASSTPIPTLTTQPTLVPSATPTLAPQPTAVPTLIPSATPTVAVIPTKNLPIISPPPTGSNSSVILTAISVILIFSGSALLFLL